MSKEKQEVGFIPEASSNAVAATLASGLALPPEEALLVWQRELAAKMFPREWAASEKRTGKAKSKTQARLRKQAVEADACRRLRFKGASCGSCEHYINSPVGRACDLDSDFYGYQTTSHDNLCSRWQLRPGATVTRAAHLRPANTPTPEGGAGYGTASTTDASQALRDEHQTATGEKG